MRVGDYVRTKDGTLGKIIDKYKVNDYYKIKVDIRNGWIEKHKENLFKKYITKSSPNIIDLIEVGDYVNGRYVDKYQGKLGTFYELPTGKWKFIELSNEHYLISSIVTKEQFSAMEYKVESEVK